MQVKTTWESGEHTVARTVRVCPECAEHHRPCQLCFGLAHRVLNGRCPTCGLGWAPQVIRVEAPTPGSAIAEFMDW